jgi:N-ethylmaleimide reductase
LVVIRQNDPNRGDMTQLNPLLEPTVLGDLRLPNRVVMAPLTRNRAANRAPTDLHRTYYAQRATAGLIITEGTAVSDDLPPTIPAIGETQVKAWQGVTDLIHTLSGRIVLQLWHAGHPSEKAIGEFATAAGNARKAGFDGVEIAANGTYLIAQSLNPRLTRPNRLATQIVSAVTEAWDGHRVGVRLSPFWTVDDDPTSDQYTADEETLNRYDTLVSELTGLAYLHIRGPAANAPDFDAIARYRKLFDGPLIANHSFDATSANKILNAGHADAVSFATHYVANPDLVTRFALNAPLATPDPRLYYTGGAEGYVDQPMWTA